MKPPGQPHNHLERIGSLVGANAAFTVSKRGVYCRVTIGDFQREREAETGMQERHIGSINESQELLQAIIDGDEHAVAQGVDAAQDENTSIMSYNDENSLACMLTSGERSRHHANNIKKRDADLYNLNKSVTFAHGL